VIIAHSPSLPVMAVAEPLGEWDPGPP
jgi:hypothetical protein